MIKINTLKNKFTTIFIGLGLIPALMISIISTINSSDDVTDKVYNQLTAINQIKKEAIKSYFTERQGDMGVLVNIADSMQQQSFMQLNSINSLKKSQLQDYINSNNNQLNLLAKEARTHQAILKLTDKFSNKRQWEVLINEYDKEYATLLPYLGWYDFFLISTKGTIIYSVTRESDLRQKIPTDLINSSFYQAFELAKKSTSADIQFGDFLP